ncbi:hypothetical protein ACFO3J_32205 [Streptomyces polygonati]|uniref:CHRD domain-containing protein n=1 Tax=Streptomyces polygonati TaxID=1617087 RepID=A0ABV8HYR4_9ACTN
MNKAVLSAAAIAALGITAAFPALAAADSAGSGSLQTTLNPVPTNHVTGSGMASVTLNGDRATVDVTVSGLLAGVPHAMHIHVDGQGICPPASTATQLNGHTAINTTDGMKSYGMIGTSLTTTGDTTPASALAVTRFPMGSSFHYHRTVTVTNDVVANLKAGKAAIVVHGIDYDGSGKFTDVLGASELDPKLPQVATAPALCGVLSAMPTGGAATGSGPAGHNSTDTDLLAAGGAMVAAAGGTWLLRRRTTQGF